MEVHIGVDNDSGLVHGVIGIVANVADVTLGNKLLHGKKSHVFVQMWHTGVENARSMKAARLAVWSWLAAASTNHSTNAACWDA